MRWVPAVFALAALMACAGESSPHERFTERLTAGASCSELFSIRNEVVPQDPILEEMNAELREIGCYSATSERRD